MTYSILVAQDTSCATRINQAMAGHIRHIPTRNQAHARAARRNLNP